MNLATFIVIILFWCLLPVSSMFPFTSSWLFCQILEDFYLFEVNSFPSTLQYHSSIFVNCSCLKLIVLLLIEIDMLQGIFGDQNFWVISICAPSSLRPYMPVIMKQGFLFVLCTKFSKNFHRYMQVVNFWLPKRSFSHSSYKALSCKISIFASFQKQTLSTRSWQQGVDFPSPTGTNL